MSAQESFITRGYWEWCLQPNEYFIINEGTFGLGLFHLTKDLKALTVNVNGNVTYVRYLDLDVLSKLSLTIQVTNNTDEQHWSGIMIGPL